MELDPDPARHGLLGARDVGVEVTPVGGEPLALIHEARVFLRRRGLETCHLAVEDELLEGAMRGMQDDGRRCLVDLARLDPNEAILDQADSMQSAQLIELRHQGRAGKGLPCHRHWNSPLKVELDESSAGGGGVHRRRPVKCVLGGFEESILQDPGFDGAPPQILIDTVRRLRLDINGQSVGACVLDLLVPGHRHPIAKWRQHLEMRGQGADGDVETDLVVALAGRAVRNPARPFTDRHLDQQLRDQWPAKRRGQRVLTLVDRPRPQGWPAEALDEGSPGIEHIGLDGAGDHRSVSNRVEIRLASEIGCQGNHVKAATLGQPVHRDGRVEATGIREDNLLAHLAGSPGNRRFHGVLVLRLDVGTQARQPLRQATVRAWLERKRDEDGVVARHRPEHLRPPRAIDGRGERIGGPRRRGKHRDALTAPNGQRQVAKQPAQPLLAPGGRGGAQAVVRFDVVAFGPRDADQAELSDVSRDGGLSGDDASALESVDQLFLSGNLMFIDDREDRLLSLTL